jgi:predicted transcriptional regulator
MTVSNELLERVRHWPIEDQRELADYARVIEARRTGLYRLSNEERRAVEEGLAEADRGEFVSDAEIAKQDKRHGA